MGTSRFVLIGLIDLGDQVGDDPESLVRCESTGDQGQVHLMEHDGCHLEGRHLTLFGALVFVIVHPFTVPERMMVGEPSPQ